MEILRVENLTKIYGKGSTEVKALDNVSFRVNRGGSYLDTGSANSSVYRTSYGTRISLGMSGFRVTLYV